MTFLNGASVTLHVLTALVFLRFARRRPPLLLAAAYFAAAAFVEALRLQQEQQLGDYSQVAAGYLGVGLAVTGLASGLFVGLRLIPARARLEAELARGGSRLDWTAWILGGAVMYAGLVIEISAYHMCRTQVEHDAAQQALATSRRMAETLDEHAGDPRVPPNSAAWQDLVRQKWSAQNRPFPEVNFSLFRLGGRSVFQIGGEPAGSASAPRLPWHADASSAPQTVEELLARGGQWRGIVRGDQGQPQVAGIAYAPRIAMLAAVHVPRYLLDGEILIAFLPWAIGGGLSLWAVWPISLVLLTDSYRRERALAERRLLELERHQEYHRAVFENAFDGVAVVHLDGIFRFITPASERITGRRPEEFIGRMVTETLHPDDRPMALASLAEVAASPNATVRLIVRSLHVDGDYRHIEVQALNLSHIPSVAGILASFRDVTTAVTSEARLRESEQNYRRLIETTREGVWVIDRHGYTTFVNPRMAEMFGYRADQMLGRSMYDFMADEHRASAEAHFARRRRGVSEEHEFAFRHRDGHTILTLLNASPLKNEAGEFIGALAMVSDITARRRAEDELRANEQLLRHVMTAARMSGWSWDPESDALTWTDDVEVTVDIPLVRPWDSLQTLLASVHMLDREATHVAFERASQLGEPLEHEFRVYGRDGREYWLVARGRLALESLENLHRPADILFGLIVNITVRKHAEVALMESRARLTDAQEVAHVGSWEWYPVICAGDWSDEMYRLLGLAPGAITPSWVNLRSHFHPDDVAAVDRAMNDIVAIGLTLDDRFRIRRTDGEVRIVRLRAKSVEPARVDASLRIIGTCHDITELCRTEHELRELTLSLERRVAQRTASLVEKNAELESFAYTISHDLRAPLRAVMAFADALREDHLDALPPDGQDYLQHIVRAAQRMDELIVDLLAYSSIVRRELYFTPVELQTCVDNALHSLEAEIRRAGAEIEVQRPLDRVDTHPGTTERVIGNLISNAIKFVPPGQCPKIRVFTESRGDVVRLWVVDNGIGIPDDQRERVFRLFERLHGEETFPGSGVGLAIVARAMDRLSGRCGVENGEPFGSRFWIELPSSTAVVTGNA